MSGPSGIVRVVIALLSTADVNAAIHQLRSTAQEAGNVAGASVGRTPIQIVDRYLAWAENAERMLPNVLDVDLVDDLVHTQRYWALRTARGDEPRLAPTVLAEMERRQRVLDALAAELELERLRWGTGASTLLVPDTNLFLQKAAPFAEIDWQSVVQTDGEVRVVVPLIVVHELDRLKRQGNSTTATLARTSLRWLLDVLPRDPQARSGPLTAAAPSTTVEAYVHDGPSRPEDADGLIITVTAWIATVSSRSTLLITRDLGMRLRAVALGVDTRQVPDR